MAKTKGLFHEIGFLTVHDATSVSFTTLCRWIYLIYIDYVQISLLLTQRDYIFFSLP